MTVPDRQDLNLTRGDKFQIDLTMTTNDVNAIDITDWSQIKAQVRDRPDSKNAYDFGVQVINTSGGVVRLTLSTAQTDGLSRSGLAVWDMERVESGALQTVVSGSVIIHHRVTH